MPEKQEENTIATENINMENFIVYFLFMNYGFKVKIVLITCSRTLIINCNFKLMLKIAQMGPI